MSTIKAVDKLRRNLREWVGTDRWETLGTQAEFDALVDEIEAEIERDYMRLPVDVNNEPVHIGDEMEHRSKHETLDVVAVGNDRFFTGRWADDYVCCVEVSAQWHHVKPRTLEDVLSDFAVTLTKTSDKTNGVAKAVDECAGEIRELLGVGR